MRTIQEGRVRRSRRWRDPVTIRSEATSAWVWWRRGGQSTGATHHRLVQLYDEAEELAAGDSDYDLVAELRALVEECAQEHEREFGPEVGGQLALRYLKWKSSAGEMSSMTSTILECERALGKWMEITSWHRERIERQIESITR